MAIQKQLYVVVDNKQNYRVIQAPYFDLEAGDRWDGEKIVCKTDWDAMSGLNNLIASLNHNLKKASNKVQSGVMKLNQQRLGLIVSDERSTLDWYTRNCNAVNEAKALLRDMRADAQIEVNNYIINKIVK